MSVFKHIKDATYQIELLKKKLPYIKSEEQQVNMVNLINSFIKLLNDCEMLLEHNIKTDVIDKLLLARIYSQLWARGLESDIDLYAIVNNIDTNLVESKEMMKHRIITFLQQKEIENIVKEIPTKQKGSTLPAMDKSKVSSDDVDEYWFRLQNVRSNEEYDVLIEDLLTEFKQTIEWN